jgi:hypothetical protein
MAEDLDRLKQNMAQTADAIRKSDATAAAALSDARQAAEDARLDQKMTEAADAIDRNRIAQAQEAQRKTEDGLREMLSRLDRRQMQQLAVLSKRLQGAAEKVKALIDDQKTLMDETKRLPSGTKNATSREQLARRQRGLARAAGAVADDVANLDRASGPARAIRQAGGRMTRAAARLDQDHADQAGDEQAQAVRQLSRALETLEKLRAQAQADMAAKTLTAITKEMKTLRDSQAAINRELDTLAQRRSKSREFSRIELRRLDKLADRQRGIAGHLERLRVRVQTAQVYDWVMRRIGADMTDLAGRFEQRRVNPKATRLAATILERLGHLVAGLEQKPPDDDQTSDPFAEGSGTGQGSATKDKPVPTVAELVVLKALQSEVNRQTEQKDLQAQMTKEVGEKQLEEMRDIGREQEQVRALTEQIVRRVRR